MPGASIIDDILSALSQIKLHAPAHPDPAPSFTAVHDAQSAAVLAQLPPAEVERGKSLLLTLHVLFPHEFLPALDILDRELVSRLTLRSGSPSAFDTAIPADDISNLAPPTDTGTGAGTGTHAHEIEIFYVQSSAGKTTAARNRARRSTGATAYEVRLDSWNCTCAAFAASAVQSLSVDLEPMEDEHEASNVRLADGEMETETKMTASVPYMFGGVVGGLGPRRVPVCKHILAALLGSAVPALFGQGVQKKSVSRDEITGWGGGYGELG